MSYQQSESMANLNRQDARDARNEDQEMPSAAQRQRRRTLPNYLEVVDTVESFQKEHPKFLVDIFLKLSKKYASIQAAIYNTTTTILDLEGHRNAGTLPNHFKLQQKMIDSISDIQDKRSCAVVLLNQAIGVVAAKQLELTTKFESALTELNSKLDLIKANSRTFSTDNLNIDGTFLCFIEYTLYQFAAKKVKDIEAKERKQMQLNKRKEVNETPKVLSTREFDRLTNQIKSLERQVQKKPKNVKGGSLKKKKTPPTNHKGTPKPKTKNNGKKNGKGNGNKRNTTGGRL